MQPCTAAELIVSSEAMESTGDDVSSEAAEDADDEWLRELLTPTPPRKRRDLRGVDDEDDDWLRELFARVDPNPAPRLQRTLALPVSVAPPAPIATSTSLQPGKAPRVY